MGCEEWRTGRAVESQLGPWGYKIHGSLCRSSSTGARGGYNKCYALKELLTVVLHASAVTVAMLGEITIALPRSGGYASLWLS